jgi:hypothetical protein
VSDLILSLMKPARVRRVRTHPQLITCVCGRQEMAPGQRKWCSVCAKENTRIYSPEQWAAFRAAREEDDVLVRLDGWCWARAWRDERLRELGRILRHTGWIGPDGAEVETAAAPEARIPEPQAAEARP